MQRAEQIRVLKELLGHIDAGTNVDAGGIRYNPSSAYTCEELASREWQEFFRSHPQVIGMSPDLPEVGSFLTMEDFGVPLLATRDRDGTFRAFVNVCRHRGTLVESASRGTKRNFVCPFHGWSYDTQGSLVGLPKPEQFGKVDRSCLGLVELPAAEKYGFLWVHPDPDASLDVDDLLGGLADEFASWDFSKLERIEADFYPTPMNWKFAIDTFGETYHFKVLHRNSLAQVFQGDVQAYDTFGRNHRMTLCVKSIHEMRHTPESEWHISQGGFPVYYLFPNIQVNVGSAGVTLVRVYPVPGKPTESFSQVTFYMWPEAAVQDPEFAREFPRIFGQVIRDEDYVAAASAQRGASAGTQEYVLFGRNEPALHHYHNTYRQALGLELLPLQPA
ncbi:MAG TPA: (2Fe-2S)-binding protein [Deltaproteobacteria bacterium]|nr:(2Fe-2S)-binding protein [Deltaproteobacteria bacterium]